MGIIDSVYGIACRINLAVVEDWTFRFASSFSSALPTSVIRQQYKRPFTSPKIAPVWRSKSLSFSRPMAVDVQRKKIQTASEVPMNKMKAAIIECHGGCAGMCAAIVSRP